jgi:putative transposase
MTTPALPKIMLTPRQQSCLDQIARRRTNPHRLVTRARIILEIASGTNNSKIARQLNLDRSTVLYWRERWLEGASKISHSEAESSNDKALSTLIEQTLSDKPRPGAPSPFSPEQIVRIIAVACEEPASSNRPISHWTPGEIADEVIKRGIVETISTRSVGRFLKSGRFEAAQIRAVAKRQAR